MGTFIGHAIPGSFFFMFALWWTIQLLKRYYYSLGRNGTRFRGSVTLPPRSGYFRNKEVEGWVAIVMAGIGIFVEIVAACILRGRPIHMGNIQHATMYFFFGLLGLSSVMSKTLHKYVPESENFRYILLAMAYAVEGLLFKFHLFGRDNLDITLHTLLLYVIYACVIVTLLEIKYPYSILLPLARSFFTLLQGTWFWQLAFILYNPVPGAKEWDSTDHHQWMIVVAFFAWHMAGILALMVLISVMVRCFDEDAKGVMIEDLQLNIVDDGYTKLLEPNDNSHDTHSFE